MRKQLLLIGLVLSSTLASAGLFDPILRLNTQQESGYEITVYLTAAKGGTYQVDFGNGKEDIYIQDTYTEIKCVLNGNEFKLYGDGEAITRVNCANHRLWSIDVTELPNLEFLNCSRNELGGIDLSQNDKIMELNCSDNNMDRLNVRNLMKLKILRCGGNELTELETFLHSELEVLDCHANQLSSLYWRGMPALNLIDMQHNQFAEVDFFYNHNLERLFCRSNGMTRLGVSECSKLTELECSDNELPRIYVGENPLLKELVCDFNHLEALDVSNNPELNYLSCCLNKIEELDVTHNPKLGTLRCDENKLSQLDITQNPLLRNLQCMYNRFNFATLPYLPLFNKYEYTDQQAVLIVKDVVQGESIDLSSQDNIQGNKSNFSWKLKSGESLEAGVDYVVTDGQTRFLTIPSDSVYCEITNPTYPAMTGDKALKTTCAKVQLATGMDQPEVADIKITSGSRCIEVASPYSATVHVYNAAGQFIQSHRKWGSDCRISITVDGIYIVVVDQANERLTQKVFVR